MSKAPIISFRALPEMKAAFQDIATSQDRSVSWVVERVLKEWLVQHGHLQGGVQPAPPRKRKRAVRRSPARLAMPQGEMVMGDG